MDITARSNTYRSPTPRRQASRFGAGILILLFTLVSISQAGTENIQPQPKTSNSTIYFGLVPYLSATELIKTWRPFADFLEKTLHKKIIIKTAPDFATFVQRTAEGRYDLLMTAPHFAALAVKNSGYQIIAGHSNDLAGDIVVAKNSRFQSITDLRGKTFSTPDPLAAVSMLAELTLAKYGLIPEKNIHIKTTTSHNAALIDVAEGKSSAGVALGGLYLRINASNKFTQLRKLATTDKIPHAMYIASSSFPESDLQKLRKVLINPAPGSAGEKIVSDLKNHFNGGSLITVSTQSLKRLDTILKLLETKINQE